jgi:hypothetical protein
MTGIRSCSPRSVAFAGTVRMQKDRSGSPRRGDATGPRAPRRRVRLDLFDGSSAVSPRSTHRSRRPAPDTGVCEKRHGMRESSLRFPRVR